MSKISPSFINIRTDQGPRAIPRDSPLDEAVTLLLADQPSASTQVATAVNGEFVARHARADHRLKEGDVVQIFSVITGG